MNIIGVKNIGSVRCTKFIQWVVGRKILISKCFFDIGMNCIEIHAPGFDQSLEKKLMFCVLV